MEKAIEDAAKEKAYQKRKKAEDKKRAKDEIYEVEDELLLIKSELLDLKRKHRQLLIDMEEEVGGLYVNKKEAEAEKLAQEYGDNLNNIEEEIFSKNKNMKI